MSRASSTAGEAKLFACKALMRDYQHNTATIQEISDYGACARELYPEKREPPMELLAVALVCAAISVFLFTYRKIRRPKWLTK